MMNFGKALRVVGLGLTLTGLSSMAFNAMAAVMVDTTNTKFEWTGKKKIGSKHFGKIALKEQDCKIEVDKNNQISANTLIVMDMGSVTVDDLEGEMATKLVGHLKSGDFFDVEKHPVAKLLVKKVDKDTLTVDLTIKDKTLEQTVKVTKNGDKYEGTLVFDRTKYGVIYGSDDFIKNLGDKVILNDVEVKFTLALKK